MNSLKVLIILLLLSTPSYAVEGRQKICGTIQDSHVLLEQLGYTAYNVGVFPESEEFNNKTLLEILAINPQTNSFAVVEIDETETACILFMTQHYESNFIVVKKELQRSVESENK